MYSNRQSGFTVPELLIAISIATVLMIGIVSIIVNLAGNSALAVRTSEQIRQNQSILSTIQADMPLTQEFLGTNTVNDALDVAASPLGATTGWQLQGTGTNSRILILRTYATTAAPQDDSRSIVYFDAVPSPCAIGAIGQEPVTNNIIYFVKNSTLYRRMLVEPSPSRPYCPGQTISQRRTCTTPNGTSCRERDVVVARNVASFGVSYLAQPTDATPNNTIYETDNPTADAIARSANALRIDIQTTTANPDDDPLLSSYRLMTKGNSRAL